MFVNTDTVTGLAGTIDAKNSELTSAFSETETKMNALNGAWSGVASEQILAKYSELYKVCIEGQRSMIANYTVFLRNRVATGYEQVETANISLSDAFK